MNPLPAAGRNPSTISQVLDLVASDPGRPRLTWYGDGGERVELSGAVLQNWVSKTVNLLVEEFDAAPGTVVALDLPAHWRGVLWALAAWRCGATVTLAGDAPAAGGDVVVTSRPAAWAPVLGGPGAADLVAVALPALARAFDGDLPPGTLDAAGAVMTYGDVIGWVPETDPSAVALEAPGAEPVTFADLVPAPGVPGGRVLVDGARPLGDLLRALLATWAADGSVVLASATTTAELAADPARLERLRTSERITG
ncbi:TIGR03089 family protein [Krasilnikoviella flava]|uniref:TIGR03089 family protein n=1 Tax=Krasilnikoviella flava TaxID=526729 RepID=A0A1T5IAM9_9MICO|nr:TIGR03089 family protein [Krasilnikoviella flava]SKC36227.1 TIGR03089 family protein [Krasilnikoviella flava]